MISGHQVLSRNALGSQIGLNYLHNASRSEDLSSE
jgi:hypothetical protein